MAQTMSGQWGYSVPLEEMDGNARPRPKRQNTQGSQQERDYRTMKSGTRRPADSSGIQSDSEETRQRRRSMKASNASATRKRSRNTLRDQARDRSVDNVDDSAWIHRDKLAQIEIQEMVEAGIPMRQSRRSLSADPGASARTSRSMSRSRRSMHKEHEDEMPMEQRYDGAYGAHDDFEPKRISTIDQAEEEDHAFNPATDAEIRTPEEAAMHREAIFSTSPTSNGRPGTSRIPVSTASPVPVPQNVVGRDSPLPRSRHGSTANSGNWDELMYARRARSNSMGSQVLLDDDGLPTSPRQGSGSRFTPTGESPPKGRTSGKATPGTGKRKPSAGSARPTSSAGKKRATSQTRSAPQHAPEGDPPWITNMYKPDPRLPPDQQMLPTHARRLAQEQWEREGKPGTVYDRDLRLLSDDEFPAPPSPQKQTRSELPQLSLDHQQLDHFHNTRALSPSKSPVQEAGSPTRSGTSGGYRITPTITTPPLIQHSSGGYSQHANMSMSGPDTQNATPRVPDLPEKEESNPKKSGGACACCVVM